MAPKSLLCLKQNLEWKLSELLDPSSCIDGEIARNGRLLIAARRAAVVPAPIGYDSSEIVGLVERQLAELKRVRGIFGEQNTARRRLNCRPLD